MDHGVEIEFGAWTLKEVEITFTSRDYLTHVHDQVLEQ